MGTSQIKEYHPVPLTKIDQTLPEEKKIGITKCGSSYFLLDQNMPDESFVVSTTYGSKSIEFNVNKHK